VKAAEKLAQGGPRLPEPPKHLSAASRRWWADVVSNFELESHHLKLLALAAEALDRTEQARAQIEKEGMTVAGRFGPRTHPAVAIERDSRLAFARLLRELDLDVELPAERRPPMLKRYD
jgi:phage terminase small subunit